MTGWLVETLVGASVLMLIVLAARRPVAHWFGAGWAYALWLIPAVRFVLPPLPWPEAELPAITYVAAASAGAGPVAASTGAFAWEPLLLLIWLSGAMALLSHQALRYWRLMRRLGIGSKVQASMGHEVGIIESPHVDGPLAIGLLDKWIVVPADFTTRYSDEEQAFALAHEQVHHRREDIAWNMAALAILAANWFNPVAWFAFRAFRMDQELSCDAAVAAEASADQRHAYGRAVVKSASAPGLIAACPLNHASQLKRRLTMLKTHRRSRARTIGGAATLAALLVGGLAGTASAAQDKPEAKTERRVIIKRVESKSGERHQDIVVEGRSLAELESKCDGIKSESDVTTGADGEKKRTRILICGKDGEGATKSRAHVLEGLENAKAELAKDDKISAEHRARVIAQLDQEIARLKAAN